MIERREDMTIPYKNLPWREEVHLTAGIVSQARALWETGDKQQVDAVAGLVSKLPLLPQGLSASLIADASPLFDAFDKTVRANRKEGKRPVYETNNGLVYKRIDDTLKVDELRVLVGITGLEGKVRSVDEVALAEGCAKISIKHKYLAAHRELSRMLRGA